MKLKVLYQGNISSINAVVLDNGDCPAEEFLKHLERTDKASYKSLAHTITLHADYGTIRNKEKSKIIEGRGNLLEFKTRNGDRLVYFYLPGHRTILTHGFHKGAVAKAEYTRADKIRDQYCREFENGK
jgi:hypothetical protein